MIRKGGYKSAAELMLQPDLVGQGERPRPPSEFSKEEKALWLQFVNRQPPDWFVVETLPLLRLLVVNVVVSRRVEDEMRAINDASDPDYKELMVLYQKLSSSISSLSTKLRLTNQSRYAPRQTSTIMPPQQNGRGTGNSPRPWQLV